MNSAQLPETKIKYTQNRFIPPTLTVGAILLMWLLISVNGFSYSYRFYTNEVDVLPSVRQFVEPEWLPNDWYLNLGVSYRYPFNFLFGTLVSWLGFQYGSIIGRLLLYLLLAIVFYIFFKAFRLRIWLGFLVLIAFLSTQSLVAGEWMIGAAETKTVAYAFAILSCALFFKKRYLLGFAFAGAALSFHVLIGLYAAFCVAAAIILNKPWYSEWRVAIKSVWPFFVTGIFGLYAILQQLLPQGDIDVTRAWEIYVRYRLLHHLVPSAWGVNFWIGNLILATVLFLTLYLKRQSNATRYVAAYALGNVSLFLFGLALYSWGQIGLLRLYWFRFADVMIPLMVFVLIAFLLNDFIEGRLSLGFLSAHLQQQGRVFLSRWGPLIITGITLFSIFQTTQDLRANLNYLERGNRTVFRWIATNTPEDAIFLVDPTTSNFYLHAQRAMFVSFKHFPQSADHILTWYERLRLTNGNQAPAKRGFASTRELKANFYKLNEAQIQHIADVYDIGYYLGSPDQQMPFEPVYQDSQYILYKLQ